MINDDLTICVKLLFTGLKSISLVTNPLLNACPTNRPNVPITNDIIVLLRPVAYLLPNITTTVGIANIIAIILCFPKLVYCLIKSACPTKTVAEFNKPITTTIQIIMFAKYLTPVCTFSGFLFSSKFKMFIIHEYSASLLGYVRFNFE